MSFDKLLKTSVSKKTEDVVLTVGEEKVTFTAVELTMTHKLRLAEIEKNNGDTFLHWIVFCIVDQDGKRMTYEQASSLPDDIAFKFLDAVLRVNGQSNSKKKAVKKPSKKKALPKKKSSGAK